MAIRYVIDPVRRLVRLTHVSRTPLAQWRETIDLVAAHPDFERGFDFIDDLSVRVDVPSTADIRHAVEFLGGRQDALAPCRWAIVVHPEMPAVFGMVRMAESLMSGSPITLRPFTSVSQALIWLGPQPVVGSST
jgi:hypothetical protein